MNKVLLLLTFISLSHFQSNAQTSTADSLCSSIERSVDEISGEIKLGSPMMEKRKVAPAIISKFINKGKTVYYLSLEAQGSTVVVDGQGVTILFTDGSKLVKTTKIDVDSDENGFEYSAFISLSAADLVTLSTKTIKKFRLYIFDKEVNPEFAENFKQYVSCIRKQK